MESIYKTGTKNTYFKGSFSLRDKTENWATPIDFPNVFTAYGPAVRSGNWQSCTSINTPQYVIDNYFNGKQDSLKMFWNSVKALEDISWEDIFKDKDNVLNLISLANNELLKLTKH